MNSKNHGLTVGELTIAIAALILIGFIWTTLNKEKETKDVSMVINNFQGISYVN